jgi:hypothetical protein
MQQCPFDIVSASTPVIVLEHLSDVIDFVAKSICHTHIGDMSPFGTISSEIITGTHSLK